MIVSFTPMRSRSKGCPNKNIRLLNNIPLFHHVVLEAQKVPALNEVWISTDSDHYASLAPPGVLVHRRSKESASDRSPTNDVIMEFVKTHPYVSTLVLLQATSPTTTSKDIEEALQLSATGKGCVSVRPQGISLYLENEPIWITTSPRQNPNTYAADGCIYVIHTADFLKSKSIPTLPCHTMVIQHPVCDIDTEEDFEHAKVVLSRRDTAFIDIDELFVRIKSNNRTEKWSTPTLCGSENQLKSFILDLIKQTDEPNIYINTGGVISEEDDHYLVLDASESIPFLNGTIFQKFIDGKCIKMQNDADSLVVGLVKKNNLEERNVLLLLFGTKIASGLYINGNLVKHTKVGQLLIPEFSTSFETSDPLQLAMKLNTIKNVLSLDDVYVSGIIQTQEHYMGILEQHGIKYVDSYLKIGSDVEVSSSKE